MFSNNRCTIYPFRPQTCRDYDCRVFTATGIREDDRTLISRQADRWQFDLATPRDRKEMSALQAAAKFIKEHARLFPDGFVPPNPAQQAVLAIKVYTVFLDRFNIKALVDHIDEKQAVIAEIIRVNQEFEHAKDAE